MIYHIPSSAGTLCDLLIEHVYKGSTLPPRQMCGILVSPLLARSYLSLHLKLQQQCLHREFKLSEKNTCEMEITERYY